MPPRWPRKPDRNDPEYRRLDDRMNLAVHVMIYLALNSGLWFVHNLKSLDWPWLTWFSGLWAIVLLVHLIYVLAIADYSVKTNG